MSEAASPAVGPVFHLLGACHAEADIAWQTEGPRGAKTAAALAHHSRCPVGIEVPINKANPTGVVLCPCEGHQDERVCRKCRTVVSETEEYDEAYREHVNAEACEMALDRRRAESGDTSRAQIAEIRAATAARRQAEREAENTARQQRGERPVALRVKKPKPEAQRCHDGCGGMTKGGRFIAGHDAKLKSVLHAAVKEGGDTTGVEDTRAMGAILELAARGWLKPEEARHAYADHAQRTVEQQGADAVIAVAVATRYQQRNAEE